MKFYKKYMDVDLTSLDIESPHYDVVKDKLKILLDQVLAEERARIGPSAADNENVQYMQNYSFYNAISPLVHFFPNWGAFMGDTKCQSIELQACLSETPEEYSKYMFLFLSKPGGSAVPGNRGKAVVDDRNRPKAAPMHIRFLPIEMDTPVTPTPAEANAGVLLTMNAALNVDFPLKDDEASLNLYKTLAPCIQQAAGYFGKTDYLQYFKAYTIDVETGVYTYVGDANFDSLYAQLKQAVVDTPDMFLNYYAVLSVTVKKTSVVADIKFGNMVVATVEIPNP